MKKIGILLTNTGTPLAPTPHAVRAFLQEFLSDKHVVKLPSIIWWPILYGLILPIRAPASAKLYQQIWTQDGSPMRTFMQKIASDLEKKLPQHFVVEIGMNYSTPSIDAGLTTLKEKNCEEVIVLPLFPQFSNTTSQSSFDKVFAHSKKIFNDSFPNFIYINNYANNKNYIAALVTMIKEQWQHEKPDHLLISFHGMPKRYVKKGDPYQIQCETTAHLLANELGLKYGEWTLCYQSRFGYNHWLKPSTHDLLVQLPKKDLQHVDVICPGFAVDCLETLEEIVIRGKKTFLQAGGKKLRYIPALNDHPTHFDLLLSLIHQAIAT